MSDKEKRFSLANELSRLSDDDLKTKIENLDLEGKAKIGTTTGHIFYCTICGRRATSTSGSTDWRYAFVVKNWIKACLEKDAPEQLA